jgi:predicted DNA-binding transcriptional regulator AlpA
MMLSSNDLAVAFGVTKETIRNWSKSGKFPKPFLYHKNSYRWRMKDIANWLGISEEEFLRLLREQVTYLRTRLALKKELKKIRREQDL